VKPHAEQAVHPFTIQTTMPQDQFTSDAAQRAKHIELILMDVDGVLTDGRILLVPDGRGSIHEIKVFDVQDGVGITFVHRVGLRTGIITGRCSDSVLVRAKELGMEIVEQGTWNKLETFEKIRQQVSLDESKIAFIGDDLQDFPVLRRVGLAIGVANARPEVKEVCHLVTGREGGRGAVREALEFILRAQGKWEKIMERYLA
jgi:3-deoxy-D-manno-octulosonate 8-phosphate phosphatase (KDO 8-P phosphatase)